MPREPVSKIFLLLVCLSFSPGPLFAFQASTTVIVHASQMTFSEKVDNVGDHVVFWGIATGENTWLTYSLKALPFKTSLWKLRLAPIPLPADGQTSGLHLMIQITLKLNSRFNHLQRQRSCN